MTSENESTAALAELAALLDAWGGEATRWPPRVRLRIAELASASPRAGEILAEARALDALLDRAAAAPASIPPARAGALTDRILAAAMADAGKPSHERGNPTLAAGHSARPQDNVVSLPPRDRPAITHALTHSRWSAAGLMAASLLAGIYIGGSLNLAPVLQEMAEAVGMSTVIDPGYTDDLGEEETL